MRTLKTVLCAGVAGLALWSVLSLRPVLAADEKPAAPAATNPPVVAEAAAKIDKSELVALKVELPKPLFTGTPKAPPPDTTVDKTTLGKSRGDFMVPKGVALVSEKKPVKMSDENPIIGSADLITDANKEGTDGNWVELGPGLQWVQIDLQKPTEIWAIVLWHYHAEPRIYRDVVVQVSDDPDFIQNVVTIFNNDHDNSSGLGLGKEREYFEAAEGKLIDGKATKARYVRCYSKGNTSDAQNHYIEAEVYGKPAK